MIQAGEGYLGLGPRGYKVNKFLAGQLKVGGGTIRRVTGGPWYKQGI